MPSHTLPHLLGTLQEDPENQSVFDALHAAIASGDREVLGDEPIALLSSARVSHERQNEHAAAALLLDLESVLLTSGALGAERSEEAVARLKKLALLARDELLDDRRAQAALERALALIPEDEAVIEALKELELARTRWKDLNKRFLSSAQAATDPEIRARLLMSAAALTLKYRKKGRDKAVFQLFRDALEASPGNPLAVRLFARVLQWRGKNEEVVQLLLDAAESTESSEAQAAFYSQAGRILARMLSETDRAAACYERVLDLSPGHEGALRFLVDYFTRREEWEHLIALYEDALRSRQRLESEQGILLQLGMVHWRIRGKADAAEPYFERLR